MARPSPTPCRVCYSRCVSNKSLTSGKKKVQAKHYRRNFGRQPNVCFELAKAGTINVSHSCLGPMLAFSGYPSHTNMSENSICESGCVPAARPRSIRRRIEPWPRQPGSLTRVLPGAAGLPGCCRGAAGLGCRVAGARAQDSVGGSDDSDASGATRTSPCRSDSPTASSKRAPPQGS